MWRWTDLDALDNGTHGVAERAAGAGVLIHFRQMGLLVERDGLVTSVVARHVAFAWKMGMEINND